MTRKEVMKEIEYLIKDGIVLEDIIVPLPTESIEALTQAAKGLARLELYEDNDRRTISELGMDMAEASLRFAAMMSQERPKGRWVSRRYEVLGSMVQGFFCSECDQKGSSRPNFCPNCGADMRESEQE